MESQSAPVWSNINFLRKLEDFVPTLVVLSKKELNLFLDKADRAAVTPSGRVLKQTEVAPVVEAMATRSLSKELSGNTLPYPKGKA